MRRLFGIAARPNRATWIPRSCWRSLTPRGIGVQQSDVEAYKWYDIAASLAKYADVKDDVIKRRDELARAMSPAQIDEAKKLSADWKARPNR